MDLNMADSEHLRIIKKGVSKWNKWRQLSADSNHFRGANLSGADLSDTNLFKGSLSAAKLDGAGLRRANLSEADLRAAILSGADLSGADLSCANLMGASLVGANLSGANLRGADLSSAILDNADLSEANLTSTNLKWAKLNNTNFARSIVNHTLFCDIELNVVNGLELVTHTGPSTVGIDTLYKSKGAIPERFLRGCGVPDSFITQAKALVEAVEGIQFYSCFISYSGLDEEFARRLHGRLQQEHVRVWFAPYDIQGGKKLHEQIDEAIRVYDKLLILLSPNSLQSEWVMTELRKARKAERKTGKRKLFPVRLVDFQTLTDWECFDADGGKDLAVEVREYFIPDFSNWKNHDSFEAGFARLLKDLRADEKAKV